MISASIHTEVSFGLVISFKCCTKYAADRGPGRQVVSSQRTCLLTPRFNDLVERPSSLTYQMDSQHMSFRRKRLPPLISGRFVRCPRGTSVILGTPHSNTGGGKQY